MLPWQQSLLPIKDLGGRLSPWLDLVGFILDLMRAFTRMTCKLTPHPHHHHHPLPPLLRLLIPVFSYFQSSAVFFLIIFLCVSWCKYTDCHSSVCWIYSYVNYLKKGLTMDDIQYIIKVWNTKKWKHWECMRGWQQSDVFSCVIINCDVDQDDVTSMTIAMVRDEDDDGDEWWIILKTPMILKKRRHVLLTNVGWFKKAHRKKHLSTTYTFVHSSYSKVWIKLGGIQNIYIMVLELMNILHAKPKCVLEYYNNFLC